MLSQKQPYLPWHLVEKKIAKEKKWLEQTIKTRPHKNKTCCSDCVLRRIAILIVSGRVKAREIKSDKCLFGEESSFHLGKPHGGKWHAETMRAIATYFTGAGYKVTVEPKLNMGRADLGLLGKEENIFIEVKTISLQKLLFNLESMENTTFVLVSGHDHVIEFTVLKAGYKYYAS